MRAARGLAVRSFDATTAAGLAATLGLLAAAVALDGDPALFIEPTAFLLVILGTLAVTVAGSDPRALRTALRACGGELWRRPRMSEAALARALLELARRARQRGLLALEGEAGDWRHLPLLRRGIALALEGRPLEDVELVLRQDLHGRLEQHRLAEGVLRRAFEVAPAMGLVGTLVGLVKMLARLDDPAAIGPAMAVALLTTLYGALLAHLLLGPLAEKLALRGREEALRGEMEVATLLSMARGENPRYLAGRLESLLFPELRPGLETEN